MRTRRTAAPARRTVARSAFQPPASAPYLRLPTTDPTIRAVLRRSSAVTPGCTGSGSTSRAARSVSVGGPAGRRDAVLYSGILWTGTE